MLDGCLMSTRVERSGALFCCAVSSPSWKIGVPLGCLWCWRCPLHRQHRAAADLVRSSNLESDKQFRGWPRAFVATSEQDPDLGRVEIATRSGLLCPPKDVRALAAQLKPLVHGPELCRCLGDSGPSIPRISWPLASSSSAFRTV